MIDEEVLFALVCNSLIFVKISLACLCLSFIAQKNKRKTEMSSNEQVEPSRKELYFTAVQKLLPLLMFVILFVHHAADEDYLLNVLQSSFQVDANHTNILQELERAMYHLMRNGGPHNGNSILDGEAFRSELFVHIDDLRIPQDMYNSRSPSELWLILTFSVGRDLDNLLKNFSAEVGSHGLALTGATRNALKRLPDDMPLRRQNNPQLVRPAQGASDDANGRRLGRSGSKGSPSTAGADSLSNLPVAPGNTHTIMRPRTVNESQPRGETAHEVPLQVIDVPEQEHVSKPLQICQPYTGFMPPNINAPVSTLTGDDETTDTVVSAQNGEQTILQQFQGFIQDPEQQPDPRQMAEFLNTQENDSGTISKAEAVLKREDVSICAALDADPGERRPVLANERHITRPERTSFDLVESEDPNKSTYDPQNANQPLPDVSQILDEDNKEKNKDEGQHEEQEVQEEKNEEIPMICTALSAAPLGEDSDAIESIGSQTRGRAQEFVRQLPIPLYQVPVSRIPDAESVPGNVTGVEAKQLMKGTAEKQDETESMTNQSNHLLDDPTPVQFEESNEKKASVPKGDNSASTMQVGNNCFCCVVL